VTTQDPVRQRALVVPDKADRVFNFHEQTLKALKELTEAAGLQHPQDITAAHIMRRTSDHEVKTLAHLMPFVAPQALLAAERNEAPWPQEVFATYWPMASAHTFKPVARAQS
jgi:hypothetical protein